MDETDAVHSVPGVQRSMGIVMMAVLVIAVIVEVAILIAEVTTRARLIARSLSSKRAVL